MGLPVARLFDRCAGTCFNPAHGSPLSIGGSIITAAIGTSANSLGIARLGDTVQADCGHLGTITSGSSSTFVNSLPVAVLGSTVAGDYVATVVQASPDTTA